MCEWFINQSQHSFIQAISNIHTLTRTFPLSLSQIEWQKLLRVNWITTALKRETHMLTSMVERMFLFLLNSFFLYLVRFLSCDEHTTTIAYFEDMDFSCSMRLSSIFYRGDSELILFLALFLTFFFKIMNSS